MPCISGSYNPAVGPLIQVAILDAATAMNPGADGDKNPKLDIFKALIDTGATSTCISGRVVSATGLAPSGKTLMTGATGVSYVDQFTFGVGFLLSPEQQPTGETMADVAIRRVQGCLFHNGGFAFDVLLGRDIICGGSFTLSFDGHFILSI